MSRPTKAALHAALRHAKALKAKPVSELTEDQKLLLVLAAQITGAHSKIATWAASKRSWAETCEKNAGWHGSDIARAVANTWDRAAQTVLPEEHS